MKPHVFLKSLVCLAVTALILTGAMLGRARFLPEVEVPILLYDRVASTPGDAYTVPVDIFYRQMRDLASLGYKTVSPARLHAYAVWGIPLPEKPFVVTFDNAYLNLLSEVVPILQELDFKAVVNLSTRFIAEKPDGRRTLNGEPMLTWTEIRTAMKEGLLNFGGHTRNQVDLLMHEKPFNEIRASRTDIKRATGKVSKIFSYPFGKVSPEAVEAAKKARMNFAMTYGDTVAKIGPKTDFLTLPRLRVMGGNQVFGVEVVEERSAGSFGFVRVTHAKGPSFPVAVLVYGNGAYEPFSIGKDEFKTEEPIRIVLPASVEFPIEVEILEKNRILLYYREEIKRSEVVRETRPGQPPLKIDYKIDIEPVS